MCGEGMVLWVVSWMGGMNWGGYLNVWWVLGVVFGIVFLVMKCDVLLVCGLGSGDVV